MNELKELIALLPESDRVVCSVTIKLESDGIVAVSVGGNRVASMIFREMVGKEMVTRLQGNMDTAGREAVMLLQSSENVGAAIDMTELRKQARGMRHE